MLAVLGGIARSGTHFIRRSSPKASARNQQRCVMAATIELQPRANAVLDYWLGPEWQSAPVTYFPAEKSKIWFMGGPEVDKEIIENFTTDCEAYAQGQLDDWQGLYGRLAGIIIGDQLTRNVYRGTSGMFQNDERALSWSKALLAGDQVKELRPIERMWIFMPFMHSEVLQDQQECVRLFEALAEECSKLEGGEALVKMMNGSAEYAKLHAEVIEKWGRFPHRNALLGRESTPEEVAGLADGSIRKF